MLRYWVALPFGLVVRQPDLGTALLIGASGFLFCIWLGSTGASSLAARYWADSLLGRGELNWLHDYQKERILTVFNPQLDAQGMPAGTPRRQRSRSAPGPAWQGLAQWHPDHLEFLPEKHTDFIFAVYGEEFGLLGCAVLVLLYLLMIGRAAS